MNMREMNRQTNAKQTKARANKKTAESAEYICAVKRLFKIKTNKRSFFKTFPAISPQVVSRKPLGLSTHRASNIRGRTEYHV